MLLISIRWAGRDHPLIFKKKKYAAKSITYPGRFGKKLLQYLRRKKGRAKEMKGRTEKNPNNGGSYEIKGLLKCRQGEREPG